MSALRVVLAQIFVAGMLVACASSPLDGAARPASGSPALRPLPAAPTPAASAVPAPSTVATVNIPPHRDPAHVMSRQRSVF